jgi:hypothetical protein
MGPYYSPYRIREWMSQSETGGSVKEVLLGEGNWGRRSPTQGIRNQLLKLESNRDSQSDAGSNASANTISWRRALSNSRGKTPDGNTRVP